MATAPQEAPRSWLDRLWASIPGFGSAQPGKGAPAGAETVPGLERARRLAGALLSERGEASGAVVARELHACLRELDGEDRLAFCRDLAAGYGPDEARLRRAAEAWLADPSQEAAGRLSDAAEPVRQELVRRMNMTPGGTAALVELRRELLGRLRGEPGLRPLDSDLRHLFASWFNRGFLELRRIDWQTPAAVLEKLIAYEAVHEIQGWEDLRRRLAPDRRCFGFFHPALPGEPLIFVEVALTEGLAGAVQPLLDRERDDRAALARAGRADTAIFYSISNCQDGLRGISFGNFLIKQVVEELKAELPHLRHFSTLSPVPGFRKWLEERLRDPAPDLLREDERAALLAAPPAPLPAGAAPARTPAPDGDAAGGDAAPTRPADPVAVFVDLLQSGYWWEDQARAELLRPALARLCALYLTDANGGRGPTDPVARFHLGNGARLERVNWLGNTAPRGVRESWGLMVNYLYDLGAIEENHEGFVRDGRVARSGAVDALLAGRAPPAPRRSRTAGLLVWSRDD